jgi:hypothetical protein
MLRRVLIWAVVVGGVSFAVGFEASSHVRY